MAPSEPPAAIRLRVKLPPGNIPSGADEFLLGASVPVATKIGQLREQIQQILPTNPPPAAQRILYGGRALVDNEQTLADALNIRRDPTQDEYVIHLLVKSDTANTNPSPAHRHPLHTPNHAPSAAHPGHASQSPLQPPTLPQPPHPQLRQPVNPQMQQIQAAMEESHRLMTARMAQARNGEGHVPAMHGAGLTPFGMQPTNAVGQEPAAVGAFAPSPTWGFQQAIAHGQQNRAAMGLQGVGGIAGNAPPSAQVTTPSATSASQPSDEAGEGVSPQTNSQPSTTPQQQQLPPQLQPHGHPNVHPQAGLPHALPQHGPPRRPISDQGFHVETVHPNGTRISIHHQTLNFGQTPPFRVMPGPQGGPINGLGQTPNIPPVGSRPAGPSALDTARENIVEMRRLIDDMRAGSTLTDEERTRLTNLEQRTQSLNSYIDPFGVGAQAATRTPVPAPTGLQATQQAPQAGAFPGLRANTPDLLQPPQFIRPPNFAQLPNVIRPPNFFTPMANHTLHASAPNSTDVTCYLLSSPRGPEAVIYHPRHGVYTGRQHQHLSPSFATIPRPTPTLAAPVNGATGIAPNAQHLANQMVAPGQAVQAPPPPQPQQGQAAPAGAAGALQPLLGHFWLLLRILIFAYFFLGGNLGWQRPLILLAVGVGFWLIRLGLLGDGGVLRRWWDDVIGVAPQRPPQDNPPNQEQPTRAAPPAGGDGAANNIRPGQMPTPEQVAQRLLDEQRRAQIARWQWVRERLRPVERTVALLVASLWPGVGEAHVRVREQEERRLAEEEIAARQRAEEDRRRREEAQEKEKESTAEAEKADGSAEPTVSEAVASTGLAEKSSTETGSAGPAS